MKKQRPEKILISKYNILRQVLFVLVGLICNFNASGQPSIWNTSISTIGAPSSRAGHTIIWTGNEYIIWGGVTNTSWTTSLGDGYRYNPITNVWTLISSIGAPSARDRHTAVWTGSEMIIWGGVNNNLTQFNNGAKYNPQTNTWTTITTTNAPSARIMHAAVWTGTEMIIWGGGGSGYKNDGGRYNPVTNSWTTNVTTTNAPAARSGHSAIWTGSEMIIWGGYNSGSQPFNDGKRYNPLTNSWGAVTSTLNAPSVRGAHVGVWTGTEMIIWGGNSNSNYYNNGYKYSPTTNTWSTTLISNVNAPSIRANSSGAWSGADLFIWGGNNASSTINNGGILTNNIVLGQNPYLLVPIDTIQFVSNSKLVGSFPNDSSNYVNPTFSNSLYTDTVKFEGYVLFDPRLYGLSASRKSTIIIKDTFGSPWGGVEVMCEPAGSGKTLTQLLNETKFYSNLKVGTKVRVTGVMRTFRGTAPAGTRQGNSQINVIANNYWDNSIQIINPNPIQLKPTKIRLDSLMMGNDSIGRVQNKISGEKWEGVYVQLSNLKVRNRTQSGSRWFWSVEDSSGNSIDVSDFSGWFRNDNNSDSLLPISRFTPPQIGQAIKSFKGVIVESSIAGQYRYTIAPLQPSDIDTTAIINLSFSLPIDSIIVQNIDSAFMNAGGNFYQYKWSNGYNSKISIFNSSGWYFCTVFDSLENSATDSVFVNILNPKIITPKSTICRGDSITLKVSGIGTGNLKQGLVAFYPFNGNAKNIVDSLSNGIVSNAILTYDRFENPNAAYSFNGSNSNITSISGFGIDTGSLTISCWAKPDLTASFDNTLLSLYNTNIYVDYGIRMFTDSSISGIRHRPCVVGDRVGISNFVKNQWNFMAVSYNSITDTMTFYLNGKLISKMKTLDNGSTCNTTTSRLTIGADFSLGSITRYKGQIDDVSIYNRELNITEVNQIYTGQNITNSFIWSNGDTTQSIKVSPSDSTQYWVKQYNNWNQCFDTIQISVDKPNTNFLSDSIVQCKLDSVLLTAPVGYNTYLWNGFDSSSTIYAKPFNKYSCKITSANGCFASDSTFVNLLNPKIKSDKQIICFRDSITLTTEPPKPNVDTSLQYITTFQNSKYYSLNSYTSWARARDIATAQGGNLWIVNSQQENDSVYSKIKNNQQFYWIGLSRNTLGNWKWVDNTDISYSNWGAGEPNNSSYCGGEEPYAAINWGGITSYGSKWNDIPDSTSAACMINRTSRAIIEIPINRVNNQFRIEWSTGDTTESIKVSPEYTTPFWVKYFNNGNSCIDTVTIQVNKPNVGFHINSNQQCFNSHKFEFYNNSSVNFGTISNEWLFEDGVKDTSTNPIKYFLKDSVYAVKLKVISNYGCKDSMSNLLTIFKNPIAKFSINDSGKCSDNNLFLFTNQSIINNSDSLKSYWIFNGIDTIQGKDASKSFANVGKFKIKLVVTSSSFCRDSMEKEVEVFQKPIISSILGKINVKPLSNETYSVGLIDSSIFRWQVLGGNLVSGQNTNMANVQWGNASNGYIGVIATDKNGCLSDSANLSISITTVGLENLDLASKFNVYPNPTSSLINIEYDQSTLLDYRVVFMDINGKILIGNKNLKTIDITNYSEGIYYLEIESEGRKFTKKIVKVH